MRSRRTATKPPKDSRHTAGSRLEASDRIFIAIVGAAVFSAHRPVTAQIEGSSKWRTAARIDAGSSGLWASVMTTTSPCCAAKPEIESSGLTSAFGHELHHRLAVMTRGKLGQAAITVDRDHDLKLALGVVKRPYRIEFAGERLELAIGRDQDGHAGQCFTPAPPADREQA